VAASGVPRSHIVLTTKVSPYQHGEAGAAAACEASLAALGAPIDLVLVHWPGAARQDAASPANAAARRQTWRVLERYHQGGAFRAIGVSNYEVRVGGWMGGRAGVWAGG
jgi:diketogulonate reductase-like aldo/keto reductase